MFRAGAAVFEQGDTAARFLVLLHAPAAGDQVTPAGQQVAIRIVNPGDLFGTAEALRRPESWPRDGSYRGPRALLADVRVGRDA